MKFECGDLDRALAVSDLMPEAREHLKHCAACRREYRVWAELSTAAKGLREEWDTPLLWPGIRRSLEAHGARLRAAKQWRNSLFLRAVRLLPSPLCASSLEAEEKLKPKRSTPQQWMRWGALAAGVLVAMGLLLWMQIYTGTGGRGAAQGTGGTQAALSSDRDFLTEQALAEVERTESAYRQSIGRLSALAQPRLRQSASAVTVSYREKLLILDSAISDTRSNLDQNRFNVRLRTDLADLYREKQQTLKELLTNDLHTPDLHAPELHTPDQKN